MAAVLAAAAVLCSEAPIVCPSPNKAQHHCIFWGCLHKFRAQKGQREQDDQALNVTRFQTVVCIAPTGQSASAFLCCPYGNEPPGTTSTVYELFTKVVLECSLGIKSPKQADCPSRTPVSKTRSKQETMPLSEVESAQGPCLQVSTKLLLRRLPVHVARCKALLTNPAITLEWS